MGLLNRAYSLLDIKSIDTERRLIEGIASTPEPDRLGDIVDPVGASFAASIPLLLHHDTRLPVGTVTLQKSGRGLSFTASIPTITEPGTLQLRVDEAWQTIRAGLIKGVSIGFRALENGIERMKDGGLKFTAFEVLELSLVAVPANGSATILAIKALDQSCLAASGVRSDLQHVHAAGVSASPVVRIRRESTVMKTISEQIQSFEATRQAKNARMTEIMQKSADEGVTLDVAQSEEYDTLDGDVKSVDAHLVRLRALEQTNRAMAVPVAGATVAEASQARGGSVISVKENLPPGIEFARVVLCKLASFVSQGSFSPMDVAKARYPDSPRIQQYLMKGAVPAGTTTDPVWASPLVDTTNLASEFMAYLRPETIIGKFGTNGIPSLRNVPFNVRISGQASGGTGYWVAQGAPKPLTSFAFESITLLHFKVAAIAVITEELARFSSPSAEALVREALRDALIERLDLDFIDPTTAAVTGVNPASITNGVTALSSAGATADNARTDIQNLLESFILANINPSGLVLIMPNTLALALSVLTNTLGSSEFPGLTMRGGMLMGIPVITSQYAANQSGAGNMVIAVNANEVFLADDGQVTVDVSREASLQMLDNPTNNSATATATTMVSLWQTNSIGLRAERFINWQKRRAAAVAYMDDVNWGSIGSPS